MPIVVVDHIATIVIGQQIRLSRSFLRRACLRARRRLLADPLNRVQPFVDLLARLRVFGDKRNHVPIRLPPPGGARTERIHVRVVVGGAILPERRKVLPLRTARLKALGHLHRREQINGFIENVKMLNEDLDILGIVVTKYNGRRVVDKNVVDVLRKEWGSLLFDTAIRENSAIVKAPLMKRDVATYDRTCNGTKDYLALLGEIVNRVNN